MSDTQSLVARLRAAFGLRRTDGAIAACEAADALERLEMENAELLRNATDIYQDNCENAKEPKR